LLNKNNFIFQNYNNKIRDNMEYIEGVDKYHYLCNLNIPDDELELMKKEAIERFLKLTQSKKNEYYDDDIEVSREEEISICNGGKSYYDRKREVERIIQYICRRERSSGKGSFSILDLETGKNESFLGNGIPMIKQCATCKNTEDCMLCGKCKKIYYCCGDCQKKDWPSHKNICK
jgi:hypothetical protein